ncbi:MAG: FecR domain-containing protein [Alcaligenes sp.]
MHLPDGMSSAGHAGVSEAVALEAARWYLLFKSGEGSADDQRRLQQWRGANAAHEIAWQRAERLAAQFSALPSAVSVPVLGRDRTFDRRAALKTVAGLLMAPTAGWLAWQAAPEWLADHRTATGETRLVRLDDGTQVWLDTASAIDVAYSGHERLLRLRAGRVLIDTGTDAIPEGMAGHRPFLVHCAHGCVRALGTRFELRDTEPGHTHLAVMQGAVAIRPTDAPDWVQVVQAGQQTDFSSRKVHEPVSLEAHAGGWTQGVLRARDMRLDVFLAEFGRYRPGLIRCSDEVAALRISGAFQLNDTTAVLDSLPHALPVSVRYRTRYWVTVAGRQT